MTIPDDTGQARLQPAEPDAATDDRPAAYLAAIVDASTDAIVAIGLDKRFTAWNRGAEQLFGYSAEEALGRAYSLLVATGRRESADGAFAAACTGQAVGPFDSMCVTKDRRSVVVATTFCPIFDRLGSTVGVASVGRDVTQQRRDEAELWRTSRFFELSRDLALTRSFAGYINDVNQSFERLLGWSEEEVRGRHIKEFVHPEDWAATRPVREAMVRGQVDAGAPVRFLAKDGSWHWIDTANRAIREEDLIYVSGRDITGRKGAEAALAASEYQTRRILETAHDPYVAVDAAGEITEWNSQARATFGWSREQALGREFALTVLAEHERSDFADAVGRFFATGESPVIDRLIEVTGVRRDGRELPLELTFSPMAVPNGCSFNVFMRDISSRKQTESELHEAIVRALDASRLKSQFVANMSHELRTPLNGVVGTSDLLLNTQLDAEQREYVGALRTSSDALMGVIEDILDFSKVEAGMLELEREPFELRTLVEDVCAIVAATPRSAGVELLCAIDADVPARVLGDAKRVRQVLTNLMNNAVKFTAEGEVVLRVAAKPDHGDRVTLRFEVADTGVGIDPAVQETIFESFAQADGSTTRRYGGTGLGLAIAKRLVGLMGGQIGVQSAPGKGSTFHFTLPTFALRSVDGTAHHAHDGLRGLHVLVVDDNATGRAILAGHLDKVGATHADAADGGVALAALRSAVLDQRPFDVALIDSDMPGMTAVDLTQAIHSDAALSGVRVIELATSLTRPAVVANGTASERVVKPVRPARLYDALASLTSAGEPTAAEVDGARASGGDVRGPTGTERRVLLAEDNPVNRLVAVRLLEKRGFLVDVATDGLEALEMHARGRYEAIFMDCQMPELDGYDATREIRRREGAHRHTPIIAMTASTMPGDIERCLDAGMDFYSGKPVHPGDLDDVIAAALGGGAAVAPHAVAAATSAEAFARVLAPTDGAPLFDPSILAEVCQGDTAGRLGLINAFLVQARADIAELTSAITAADFDKVEHAAHRLKGGAASVGAVRLAAVGDELCRSAHAGELADTARSQLDEAFHLTEDALAVGADPGRGASKRSRSRHGARLLQRGPGGDPDRDRSAPDGIKRHEKVVHTYQQDTQGGSSSSS